MPNANELTKNIYKLGHDKMIGYDTRSPMRIKDHANFGLKTGEHVALPNILPDKYLKRLQNVASRLNNIESRLCLEKDLGENTAERYTAAGINIILQEAKPWIKTIIGKDWLILTNKVLLRRTWPIGEVDARKLGHNASNLTWHQDSNYKHGSNPMVVMMVVLQNGAGLTRPGLSILESYTNQFEGIFGYEGNKVDQFEQMILERHGEVRIANPILNSGDLLIFNGLTFHRTFANQTMNAHRDALLIRIVRPKDAGNFPGAPHMMIKNN